MCAVSMIHDYYRPQWPWNPPQIASPPQPWVWPLATPTKPRIDDPEILKKIRKLIADAKEIDDALGEVDCSTPDNEKKMTAQKLSSYIQSAPPVPNISGYVRAETRGVLQ